MENDIFWSEIKSGFGEPGGTPQPRIPRSTPRPPRPPGIHNTETERAERSSKKLYTVSRRSDKNGRGGPQVGEVTQLCGVARPSVHNIVQSNCSCS